MGFLDLFRKDAGAALDKAERYLEAGDRVGALDVARRHIQDKDPGQRERAQELVTRCRRELIDSSLEKAAAAEAAGDHADAADWVRAALQHVTDETRRGDLTARQAELERQAELSGREPDWDAAVRREEASQDADASADDFADDLADDESGFDESASEDDLDAGSEDDDVAARVAETAPPSTADYDPVEAEIRFDLLVDTFTDEVAERYQNRGDDFRFAFLAINDGDPERALELLESLVEADPDDPVLHLERGRCRLLLDDPAGARRDLEAAWESLGDDPLDRAGSLRVPTLWAEASLEAGQPGDVLERLEELARPSAGDGDLTALYGRALVSDGSFAEARRFLARAYEHFSKRQDLPFLLAQVLAVVGERQLAIDLLERAVAPSCAGGSCSKPPLHLPSLRALAALHLGLVPQPQGVEEDAVVKVEFTPGRHNLDRVDDLMSWIAGAQGGRLSASDHLLAARYHELVGDEARAEKARRHATRALELGAEAVAAPGDLAASTGKAAL